MRNIERMLANPIPYTRGCRDRCRCKKNKRNRIAKFGSWYLTDHSTEGCIRQPRWRSLVETPLFGVQRDGLRTATTTNWWLVRSVGSCDPAECWVLHWMFLKVDWTFLKMDWMFPQVDWMFPDVDGCSPPEQSNRQRTEIPSLFWSRSPTRTTDGAKAKVACCAFLNCRGISNKCVGFKYCLIIWTERVVWTAHAFLYIEYAQHFTPSVGVVCSVR